MTILAQNWLEDHRSSKFDYWLELRLSGKTERSEVVTFASTTVGMSAIRLEETAERYVFYEDLSLLRRELLDSGQLEAKVLFETIKLPSKAVWIEWPVDDARRELALGISSGDPRQFSGIRTGVLFDVAPETGRHAGLLAYAVVVGFDKRSGVVAAGRMTTPPYPMRGAPRITCDYFQTDAVDENFWDGIVLDALVGMFLAQQPKVVEITTSTPPEKLQRARAKRRQKPLIEFQRVNVKIGLAHKRRASEYAHYSASDSEDHRRRYHRVVGHFRIYKRGTPEARAVWIEEHYRGDPKLGILIRERHVERMKT